jgi:hypothetical protein
VHKVKKKQNSHIEERPYLEQAQEVKMEEADTEAHEEGLPHP